MKYNKNDFIRLYKTLYSEDIEKKIKEEMLSLDSTRKDLLRLDKRISGLQRQLSSPSPSERQEAKVALAKLRLIRESYVVDDICEEDREKRLAILIERLAPVLEDIIANVIKLEEMEK